LDKKNTNNFYKKKTGLFEKLGRKKRTSSGRTPPSASCLPNISVSQTKFQTTN
jgi:hypothetical protein